jgi:hypothetical protein
VRVTCGPLPPQANRLRLLLALAPEQASLRPGAISAVVRFHLHLLLHDGAAPDGLDRHKMAALLAAAVQPGGDVLTASQELVRGLQGLANLVAQAVARLPHVPGRLLAAASCPCSLTMSSLLLLLLLLR